MNPEAIVPDSAPEFSLVYTITIILAVLLMAIGVDPLKSTIFSMALTAASLPLTNFPFIFLMNDKRFVKQHTNGRLGNVANPGDHRPWVCPGDRHDTARDLWRLR